MQPDHNDITIECLRQFAEQFVAEASGRPGAEGFWQTPLLAASPIDTRFIQLTEIASKDHLHPYDLLPSAKSVIAFFIPFRKALVKENQAGDRPCRNWGVAYVQTNNLIDRLSQGFGELLAKHGFKSSLTPATHNFHEAKLMARWSHKHLAHLVGLGRFGIHHMLITPAGCAGRLGSIVTEAELGEHAIIETHEACLLKAGQPCGRCIQACPVNALSEDDFDRGCCWNRLKENYQSVMSFSDLPKSTHVCGKCAAMMPCSFTNPVAALG
jgi:epoxyqueuosine reductase QueG